MPVKASGADLRPAIDLRAVAERADLRSIVEAALGAPLLRGGQSYWSCPFHDDSHPSLYLWAGGRRWRCWPCKAGGDALDFLARREGIAVPEAARRIDPAFGVRPAAGGRAASGPQATGIQPAGGRRRPPPAP